MELEIIAVRHTRVRVAEGVCYGSSNVPLAESFEREAEAVRLSLPVGPYDRIYSSSSDRCRRLATWCGLLPFEEEPLIRELHFGAWELQPWDRIDDPQLQRWYDDWLHQAPTDGESFGDQHRRIRQFLMQNYRSGFRRILCFTHGGVIASLRVWVGECTAQEAFSQGVACGAWRRFRFTEERLRQIEHLALDPLASK